jgi:short-subunit dehydrogenase involved in D-alanine esterification of teichoic acids
MGLRGNAIFTTEATGIGRALAEALLAKDNNAVISGRRKGSDP